MRASLLLFGVTAALASPTPRNYVVHERRDALPSIWVEESRLDKSAMLPMRIGLAQSNLDRGHDLLMELSHPQSPRYGQHLSSEEVHDLFAPSNDAVENVRAWIESAGIAPSRISQSYNKQWLQFDAHASEVEQLLQTEYYIYSHADTGSSHVTCHEYHVPEAIQSHIDYITPGVKMLEVRGMPSKKRDTEKRFLGGLPPILAPLPINITKIFDDPLAHCDLAVTPDCVRAMYNITKGTTSTKGNELGIFEDLGDIYSQEDLNLFFSNFASEIPQGTHPTLDSIDGATAPTDVTNAGPESDLDFQIAYPIIWPQNTILYQTDDPNYEDNYNYKGLLNNFLYAIDGSYCNETSSLDPQYPDPSPDGYNSPKQCGVYTPTNVISISYGSPEAELPIAYQRRQCHEFMKLGLQGITVVVASGDSGVASSTGACLGTSDNIFVPDFPATCPYLTVVGGTYLPLGSDAAKDEEIAVTRFPSGGGFSNIYARPTYQNHSVEAYFSTTSDELTYPYYSEINYTDFSNADGIYNRIGRGYPDVSAIADNIVIYNQGEATLVGGTSAAAPAFAAMLTRINEERLAKGKATVGFVNPVLYEHPEAFKDVTVGENPGCGTDGFPVAKGWDPVTGLGTPRFERLMDLFMSLD
ncbi:alkaline serine protease AorO [Aspergillus costaricaensis CBS 115574]|uniref:Alkaline serine protease AorO n=1 Tax=Aspergillus costaricaensis CBS 115574 TaxID=1448317 RepID=A0ACD1I6S7_9EURO|nr:alkaline serine protease AorO [Aspergillus costaricaensis CBS 115574]RAK86276.1 alkaline serine protease AorO [Aspergillus costaricaensis CBS 115574]